MQQSFVRKEKTQQQPVNLRDISQIKNAIKTSVKSKYINQEILSFSCRDYRVRYGQYNYDNNLQEE